MWRHRSALTLAQIMACSLTAPSHYLNTCWFVISEVLWHSSESSFARNEQDIYENYSYKMAATSPRDQWVNHTVYFYCFNRANHNTYCIYYIHYKGRKIAQISVITWLGGTIWCRYNMFTIIILHSALQWQPLNINEALDSQKTPHNSPLWASYGVFFVRILVKINGVTTAPNCV